MKKIQLFLIVLLVGIQAAFAQNLQVTGKVTYADDGTPVIGATINVKGTSVATLSDVNGDYKIAVPANSSKVIVVNYTGLVPQEVPTPTAGVYNIVMATDALQAEDVVVTGYGSAKRAGTTVGSSVKVSAKAIEGRPSSSALDALQGQVAGLQVYNSSGDPGSVQSVRLHGIGSLTASNTPLYVIDGTPVDARTVVSMNPNDFESMTVLKDASATSIYGSRAANGVIYISTKRGTYDSKAKITVRGQYGISSLANKAFYNQMMSTDQLLNFWGETGIRSAAQIESLKAGLIRDGITQADGSLWNTKWIDYMQQNNRPMIQADMSIQGGGKALAYYVSGSYNREEGTAPGAYFERGTVRSNLDARVNKWMKVGMNMQLSIDNRQTNPNYGTNVTSGGLSFLLQPYYSPYAKDGSTPNIVPGMTMANPYYYMQTHPDLYTRYGIMGNAYVEFEPLKNLKIRSVVGLDQSFEDNNWKTYPSYVGANGSGTVGRSTGMSTGATITNTIEYTFNIQEKHRISVLAAQEGIANRYSYYYATSKGQTDDRLMHLNNGIQSTYAMESRDNASNFLAFFGRADYAYDNRFFFDATVRNDASSRFSKNNRNATFWSVGGMWNLKNEKWLADNQTITGLNFKVSYGTQGNASIGDYASLATVGSTANYAEKVAWVLSTPGNENLKWETQKKLTVALNFNFWNKLTVGLEYYNRATDDMLMNVPVPYTTGFSSVMSNVGSLENNGIDISVNYDILRGKDYYLGVNANFNYNKEKVTKLFGGRERWEIANTGVAYVVGKPVMFYYPIYAGVNSETGAMQWYKPGANIDETTTDNGVTSTFSSALTQNTGMNRYTPMVGGFGISGGWKGIAIQADFAFAINKYLISNDRYFSENPRNFAGNNTSANVLDYWRKPGDIAQYPDWTKNYTMQFDTHLLEDASFMRLKNLTVSYTLPSKILAKSTSLTGFKVFFTGRNLWTVTNFKGIDPEVDSNLSMGRVGNSKTFSFGLELYF